MKKIEQKCKVDERIYMHYSTFFLLILIFNDVSRLFFKKGQCDCLNGFLQMQICSCSLTFYAWIYTFEK